MRGWNGLRHVYYRNRPAGPVRWYRNRHRWMLYRASLRTELPQAVMRSSRRQLVGNGLGPESPEEVQDGLSGMWRPGWARC